MKGSEKNSIGIIGEHELTHGRKKYHPTCTMRSDRGIFNGSILINHRVFSLLDVVGVLHPAQTIVISQGGGPLKMWGRPL